MGKWKERKKWLCCEASNLGLFVGLLDYNLQDMVPSLRSGVPTLKILVKFGNVATHSERFITINTIIDEGMA